MVKNNTSATKVFLQILIIPFEMTFVQQNGTGNHWRIIQLLDIFLSSFFQKKFLSEEHCYSSIIPYMLFQNPKSSKMESFL